MAVKTLDEYAALVDTLEVEIGETLDFEGFMAKVGARLGVYAPATLAGWERMWEGVQTRYSALPELGLRMHIYTHELGTIREYKEISFRDMVTGTFVKYNIAQTMIREWWGR